MDWTSKSSIVYLGYIYIFHLGSNDAFLNMKIKLEIV